MKFGRTVSLAALALVAAVTFAHAADGKMSDPSMKTSKSMKSGKDMSATLEAKERTIWEAFKNRDAASFLSVVDKDGWAADATGFSPASAGPDMMKDYELRSYTLENFKTTMVDKDAYLLTYTAHSDASYKGQAMPQVPTYISTLFVKRGNDWRAFYHQESMGMPMTGTASDSK